MHGVHGVMMTLGIFQKIYCSKKKKKDDDALFFIAAGNKYVRVKTGKSVCLHEGCKTTIVLKFGDLELGGISFQSVYNSTCK